jgi:maltose alpha-D-glucosyltransferase/alpha-amylase
MKYIHGLKSKEGGYERTGSRTPMQWANEANAGFSTASPEELYLPVDTGADRPDAASQQADPDSLWHHVQSLIEFRRQHSALDSGASFSFISGGEGSPLVYERWDEDEHLVIAFNPSEAAAEYSDPAVSVGKIILQHNDAEIEGCRIVLKPMSYIVIKLCFHNSMPLR